MTEPTTEADRPMTTPALAAKVSLRWAWFAAHENQPMPEGKAEVEALFLAIEAEARESVSVTREPGLDPEQLSEAIFRVGISRWKDARSEPLPWAVEHQQEWARWLGQAQTAIAREYAALASEDRP